MAYEKLLRLYEEAERLAKIQRFAPSSEKSKFQVNLFDEAELEQAIDDLDQLLPNKYTSYVFDNAAHFLLCICGCKQVNI